MAVNQTLVARMRAVLGPRPGLVEKAMFGGVGFMLNGNMAVGAYGQDLIVRLSPAQAADALAQPEVRVFDITGRPMKGWIMVGPAGYASDEVLAAWIAQGMTFARSLPPK